MRRTAVLAALCSIALMVACDGGTAATPSPSPTASPPPTVEAPSTVATATSTPGATATPEATPPSPPGPRRTGDPALDAIIEAVEAHDVDALLGFVEQQEVECSTGPGPHWAPCLDGEVAGTHFSGIGHSTCAAGVARDVRGTLADFLQQVDGLWAAVRANDFNDARPWGGLDTFLVFHGWRPLDSGDRLHLAMYVEVRDGRVIGIGSNCLGDLDDLVRQHGEATIAGPWHEPDFSGPRRTGDPALDAILKAVEARDVGALVGMLRTEVVECRAPDDPSQIGSPPTCEDEGVPPGTMLTVVSGAECSGYLSTDIRGLAERWLVLQDGLYGATPVPNGHRLIYHGVLSGLNAGTGLWVEDGEVIGLWFGCSQPAELVAAPDTLSHGPWPTPLTPRDEAVRTLVAPFLDAIEAGNADPLVEATEESFLGHGCTTSRDSGAALEAFVDQEPTLVAIYEPEPRGWLPQWWLVFRLNDGTHARLLVDVRPRIDSLFQPCDATLERVTQSGTGDPVPLLWAP